MKAQINKAQIYYFDKKTKQKKSRNTVVKRTFQFIPRADDLTKELSLKAANLMETLDSMLGKDELTYVNHEFLSSITRVDRRQNCNLFSQIAHVFSITYRHSAKHKGKKLHEVLEVKRTQFSREIINNPEKFFSKEEESRREKNYSETRKKFPVDAKKISRPIYKEVESIVEEDRAISSSMSSSLLNIEYDCTVDARDNTLQQDTLPPNQPQEDRTSDAECRSLSVPYGAAPCLSENNTELTLTPEQEKEHYSKHKGREFSNNQPISLLQVLATIQDIPIAANQNDEDTSKPNGHQEGEILSPVITNQDTRANEEVKVNTDKATQLRQEIFKSFNPRTSEGIMENCTFTELEPNKLGISIQAEFSLNQEDKDKLKTCIRAVYGDDVKMVSTSSQNKQEFPQAQTQEAPIRYVKTEWDCVKEKIAKYFPENQYNHVIGTWLDHLNCSYTNEEKVVVIGRAFYVDYIADKFASAIEQAVAQTRKSLVLQYEGNAQRPIEFSFKR